jgi:hypothetical protein
MAVREAASLQHIARPQAIRKNQNKGNIMTITTLWLPILVSAIVTFIAGAGIWLARLSAN